jgi:uncharacterized protein YdeI (YjbR/CyaY-like superfamily)
MGSRDPRVDAYIAKAAPFAKPILTRIRSAVHKGCPDAEETMKWSFPHFDYKGMLCAMAAFKQHCTLGFWKASLLKEAGLPARAKGAMGQFGRITSVDDLPVEKELVALVRAAARLNDDGVKLVRRPRPPKPMPKAPASFVKALRENARAKATYDEFSPSHRREYLEWITEAKTDATRDKRIATTIEWLAEGKSRNWKYGGTRGHQTE